METTNRQSATGSRRGAATRGRASRLQSELAHRILELLKERTVGTGYHLVEQDLCREFGVSRTPIRGALGLLCERGVLQRRHHRGFVVRQPVDRIEVAELVRQPERDEEERKLFVEIARARLTGGLPEQCTQQEIVRRFDAKLAVVIRVLRQMAELGLVERKPGNGWSFMPSIDSEQTSRESYQFRLAIEPAMLALPEFSLDRTWAQDMRQRHESFRKLRWRKTLAVEFYEMNAEFHEGLARASQNRYMLHAIEQQNGLRRFLNYDWEWGHDRVLASVAEHLAILTALEKGDAQAGARLMRQHLQSANGMGEESSPP